jgi:hypothetical protein
VLLSYECLEEVNNQEKRCTRRNVGAVYGGLVVGAGDKFIISDASNATHRQGWKRQ